MPTKPAFAAGILAAVVLGAVSVVIYPFYFTIIGSLLVPLFVYLYFRCGAFSPALAIGMLAFIGLSAGGLIGAMLPILAYAPVVVVIVLLLKKKAPVHYAVLYGAAAMLTALILWLVVAMLLTGGMLIEGLVGEMQVNYDFTYRELVRMYGELPEDSIFQMLSAENFPANEIIDLLKTSLLPQMVRISCLGALLGVVIPIVRLRKRGLSETVSLLSPLHTWHVPRKLGMGLVGSYLAVLLMALMGLGGASAVARAIWQAVLVVYGSSCLAFLCSIMRHNAYEKPMRNALLALSVTGIWLLDLTGIMGGIPVIVGILGENSKLRAARVMGDGSGPFGPPDPPLEKRDNTDDSED